VSGKLRLAALVALALSVSTPEIAAACSPVPPPEPPPRTAAESDSDFAARRAKWFADLFEAEEIASLPGRKAHEDRLWATAGRVVLARLDKTGSIRLRGSEGQYYKSPLATLRAVKWLKGHPSPRRLKVHFLSDDTCDHGGGDAVEGKAGEHYLLFYRDGPLDAGNILDTLGRHRAVTQRSRDAFDLKGRE
jgi:hypothetical protein